MRMAGFRLLLARLLSLAASLELGIRGAFPLEHRGIATEYGIAQTKSSNLPYV